jgi:WD40 repeat protein
MYANDLMVISYRLTRTLVLVIFITLATQVFAQPSISTIESVGWNNIGTKIAASHNTGLLEVIDSTTSQLLQSFQLSPSITSRVLTDVAWSPHNSNILAAATSELSMVGTIHILDAAIGQEIMTLAEGEQINSISWHPDGSRIVGAIGYVADPVSFRYLNIWDTSTGQVSSEIPFSTSDIFSLDWSPDGSRIAGGAGDNNITVWDANTGAVVNTLIGHSYAVYAVAWSPDGSKLASASSIMDPTIRIWNAISGQNVLVIPSGAFNLAWSPDGTRIATADIDENVRIWDTSTGELLDTVSQSAKVYDVAWSPDGSKLAIGNGSGTAEIITAPGAPTVGILDDFNRADGAVGSNWSGATSGYTIVNNQLQGDGSFGYMFWSPVSFGAWQEVSARLVSLPAGGMVSLLLKGQSATSDADGVIEVNYQVDSASAQVWTYDPTTQEWLSSGAPFPLPLQVGDTLRARALPTGTVQLFRNSALVAARDVINWPFQSGGGYLGLATDGVIVDDFGGGSLPAAAQTLTAQVSAGADDVNEDGVEYEETFSRIWIGGGENATSYTGLRFTNVTLPAGATIVSARLEFYTGENEWIGLQVQLAAENADTSAAFSSTALPSTRTLTTARLDHASDDEWLANNWYLLEDVAPLLQEVVNRPGWVAGNNLALILRNTDSSSWGRKHLMSYEGDPAFAPRLVIVYSM